MNRPFRPLATTFYRLAARFSASILSFSPAVETILVHRSVATGEVDFARSDIDLMLIVNDRHAARGANIAALYRTVRRAQSLNPALTHIDVYDAGGIATHAQIDTFWASAERRSMLLLRGQPFQLPSLAVNPEHALSKFLLWVEWFFAVSIQQKNPRNIHKIALECWNAYACAQHLIDQPCVLRSEMEALARRLEPNLATDQLGDPSYATRFVFELADRLHQARMSALRKLDAPLIFEAITAPLCLRRRLVTLPRADSALPPDAFINGAMVCTPEILDLFVHVKNAFFTWIMPPELIALGIQPPDHAQWVRSCRYYSHPRFLFHPGFANSGPPMQSARMAILHYALASVSRGEVPPAIAEAKILQMMGAGAATVADYYQTEYDQLWRDTQRMEESLQGLSAAAAAG